MTGSDVIERLDRLIAVVQLAHHDEIERARESIRSDPINSAVLDAAADWTPAGKLGESVRKKTKQSPRTISRRIAALVDQGALARSGASASTMYRRTGLI